MKKDITIATFISQNEIENEQIYQLSKYLQEKFNVEIIVFSDKKIDCHYENVKQFITPNMTKYKRIRNLIDISKFDNILCIDNDIKPNIKNITQFIEECFEQEYSIAWGKIKALSINNFISHLVYIDKNLSHDYIRPFLWKLKTGISLPGQVFMINKKYFYNKLPSIDTVYDDLEIGIITRKNNFPVIFTREILGYEKPKLSILSLLKQRIRWSKGLAETIIYNKNDFTLKYILLHGFMYHLLWIPYFIILISLLKKSILLSIFIIVFSILVLSEKQRKNFIWALCYIFIFPFVHIVWLVGFIYNLLKLNFL